MVQNMKHNPSSRYLPVAAVLAAIMLLLAVPLAWQTENSTSTKNGVKEEIGQSRIPVFSLILTGSLTLYRKAFSGRRGE